MYVFYGVLILGYKLDSESDIFDVCKYGKYFYFLEYDYKVNFVLFLGGLDFFMIRMGVFVVNFRVKWVFLVFLRVFIFKMIIVGVFVLFIGY